MKIIGIKAVGLPRFKEQIEIGFTARQSVYEKDRLSLYKLFGNIYQNPTCVIIGTNASGKTSVLKLINFVFDMMNSEPVNHIDNRDILGNTENAVITTWFYSQECIFKLETSISYKDGRYIIEAEKLFRKSKGVARTREEILEFDESMLVLRRDNDDPYLSDDVSIMVAWIKKQNDSLIFEHIHPDVDGRALLLCEEIPDELLSFLDPNVEELSFKTINGIKSAHLRLKGEKEVYINDYRELYKYLSSGTVKGIAVFAKAMEILRLGGYMIIDGIEHDLDRSVVTTLIRFFMEVKINRNGAVLIFSTYCPELLDEYDRNDCIYITYNQGGIKLKRLDAIWKRKDIKKSDAYQSGLLGDTVPSYEKYMHLKRMMTEYTS